MKRECSSCLAIQLRECKTEENYKTDFAIEMLFY